MGTRALVFKQNEDNTYSGIYVHQDGYIEGGLGETLFKCYKTSEEVDELIELGAASYIEESLDDSKFHERDMGRELNIIQEITYDEICEVTDESDTEYVYIFENDEWLVAETYKSGNLQFTLIKNIL